MRILLFVSAALVTVILAVVAVGYLLPVNHDASRERTYAASPSTVFAAISTPADLPRWRSGVKSVELLPDE
ncbi:MAG TPA: SRPBCC family protein, partial [Gemmatimonadaceae bacterium]|nr:SRPBCC family protein [Gemmatimonadaceae bacterium]